MSVEAVLAANESFYEAFRRGDLEAMDELWASDDVTCIHPGWDLLVGRQQVMASWSAILGNGGAEDMRCTNPLASVHGNMATVICGERIGEAQMIATNTFVFYADRWWMTHHHAGQVAQSVQFESPPHGPLN